MKKTSAALTIVVSLALFAGATVSRAGDVLPLNAEKLTAQAGLIFDGVCLANRVERNPQTGLVQTITTFQVSDSLKGAKTGQIEIRQYGGVFPNGDGVLVAAMPRYRQGERCLLFLNSPGKTGLTSPVGLGQGKFRVSQSEDGAGFRAANSLGNRALFRGVSAQRLVQRDSKNKPSAQDRAVLRTLQSDGKAADLADFKALIRRLAQSPAESAQAQPAGEVAP